MSTTDDHEDYVFSAWVRANTEYKMRLAYLNGSSKWIYLHVPIQLSNEWRKYWITFPSTAAGTSGYVYVLIGEESDGKSTGKIEVWKPQIEYGRVPEA